MATTTLALAHAWGVDARNAGLDRDTLEVDREAIRAIRDAAHDEGNSDAYMTSVTTIKRHWLAGYDVDPYTLAIDDARTTLASLDPDAPLDREAVLAYIRATLYLPGEYTPGASEFEDDSTPTAASYLAVLKDA